jgi:predicted amidohydrolase
VPGTLIERRGELLYNTAPVIDPTGQVITRYSKVYPWSPYERDAAPGEELVTFDVPGVGCFGVSICYDMWFPETIRAMAWNGAEVILHPSLTNTIDREVERAIARASAATNQCYFLDVNGGGDLGFGRSGLYGPGGEILHEAESGREIITVELDLDYVRRVRSRGWNGLGQTLKSFRDGRISYPQYERGARSPHLDALGPLELPERCEARADVVNSSGGEA